jgi:hypothetical protein
MPQENNVTVIWDEICTGGDELISSDILIITLGLEPELNLSMGEKSYYRRRRNTTF